MVLNNTDSLIKKEEWELYKKRKINDKDIYKIKLERINPLIFDSYTNKDKESAYIYYLMNNGYFYDVKVIKSEGLKDEEISSIYDNSKELPGIFIDYIYEREYLYGDTFKK